jgi:uncharacterized protein (TIGR03435 family)
MATMEIVGAPAWVFSDRYSVTAKGAGSLAPGQGRFLMQAFLTEHFNLGLHIETTEQLA